MAFDEQTQLTNKKPKKRQQYSEEETVRVAPKSSPKQYSEEATVRVAPKGKQNVKAAKKDDSQSNIMPLGMLNFILLGVALVLIVVGFVMMSGSSNTGDTFNYSIFESSRTVVAPVFVFLGFLMVAISILVRGPKKKTDIDIN